MSDMRLDEFTQNRIRWKRQAVFNQVEGTHLEKVLDYELFGLEQRFEEAIKRGCKKLAVEALDYAQHVELLVERHSRSVKG